MATMKAIQVNSAGADLILVNKEIPEPKDNEVQVKVEVCGICHGDAVTKEGYFPGIVYPRIPGHEIIGYISKVGKQAGDWKLGQRIGVGWHAGHCMKCKSCLRGDFWACENAMTTGISSDGGYAEFMCARTEALVSIPDELNATEAAPLLCAGTTTFGALRNHGIRGGELVAVHGLGGLGHLAVQYAVKLGFKTVVLSRGKEKEKLAMSLGAHLYIDTNLVNAGKELKKMGGARAIICTAPNGGEIAKLVAGLGSNGQLIIIAAANDPMQFPPSALLGGNRSITGWVGGNMEETLNFSLLFKVVPMVEVFPLEQAAKAYKKMLDAKVHFRAVLKMTD
jgi:propanol-preferring alcohol dehydrogenase